jgi:hypothetical protein
MARRRFLAQLAAWPLAAVLPIAALEPKRVARLKIMIKSAWGSDDPPKAAFPLVERKIPIYACGTCVRARGVTDADLANWGAEYDNSKIFGSLVEWADRVMTE